MQSGAERNEHVCFLLNFLSPLWCSSGPKPKECSHGSSFPHQLTQSRQPPTGQPGPDSPLLSLSFQVTLGSVKLTVETSHHHTCPPIHSASLCLDTMYTQLLLRSISSAMLVDCAVASIFLFLSGSLLLKHSLFFPGVLLVRVSFPSVQIMIWLRGNEFLLA